MLSFLVSNYLSAQFSFQQKDFPVDRFSRQLKLPFAGGLNNPQFSSVDFNNDSKEDLFVFDRNGNQVLTFINQGISGNADFIYAKQYEKIFPPLQNWALLTDYNCDGIRDIFTSFDFGIAVYQGEKDINGNLSFSLLTTRLSFYDGSLFNKIAISSVDIPAFSDVNNDGDLDILTFPGGGGMQLTYFENQSIEKGYGCDSLTFEETESCWGQFTQTTIDKAVTLGISCKGNSIDINNSSALHGTNAIVAFDKDNDGDKELIFGDYNFNNLNLLTNGGTPANANITEQDTAFPKNSIPVIIDRLPAPFYLDVNNDGRKDLVSAPNSPNNSMNEKNIWFYKNTGTNSRDTFVFQSDSFLVGEMIETGEGSNPVFFDYNADGLLDLLIGNYQLKKNPTTATTRIFLFKNTGTKNAPSFQFVTDDFAGISSVAGMKGVMPAFGDLDGDGDADMLIGDAEGTDDGMLHYFENTAGAGNIANLVLKQPQYQNIDVGKFSTPQLADVNRDGKLDLLIGEANGNVNYYENTGTTTAPVFTLFSSNFGGVDVKKNGFVTGYSVPCLTTLDATGKYYLLAGAESGYIYLYGNIDGNLSGNFTLIDSVFQNISEGLRSSVSSADINDDGKNDLLIGNNRGGVKIFIQDSLSNYAEKSSNKISVHVFPNPFSDNIRIKLENENTASFYLTNILGQQINKGVFFKETNLDLSAVPKGIYFLTIKSQKIITTIKLVK